MSKSELHKHNPIFGVSIEVKMSICSRGFDRSFLLKEKQWGLVFQVTVQCRVGENLLKVAEKCGVMVVNNVSSFRHTPILSCHLFAHQISAIFLFCSSSLHSTWNLDVCLLIAAICWRETGKLICDTGITHILHSSCCLEFHVLLSSVNSSLLQSMWGAHGSSNISKHWFFIRYCAGLLLWRVLLSLWNGSCWWSKGGLHFPFPLTRHEFHSWNTKSSWRFHNLHNDLHGEG